MKRRQFLKAGAAISLCPQVAWAGGQERHNLLNGGFEGSEFHLGLEIILADGWKTYWRVPGDGGIPPNIELTGANIASVKVSHPTPTRHSDEAGESIGYTNAVVFPIALTPENPAKNVKVKLNAFFGVCQQICIPVPVEIEQLLLPGLINPADAKRIAQWQAKVPSLSSSAAPLTRLSVAGHALSGDIVIPAGETLIDIFIEPLEDSPVYFRAPVLTGSSVRIEAAGNASLEAFRGHKVRATTVTSSSSLEQTLTVD
jgi:DsbC/DsbD-like thiol-disulfide interchange protein